MNLLNRLLVSGLIALTIGLPALALPSGSAADVTGRLNEIEAQLNSKGGAEPQLLEEVQALIRKNPRNARAHFIAGRLLERAGYADLAEQEFAKCDEIEPRNPEAVLELFMLKMDADDMPGAWRHFGYVSKRFPNDGSVKLMKALILNSANRSAEAEKLLNEAAVAVPYRVGVGTAIGDLRLRQGKYSDALTLAKKDLQLQPQNFRANVVAGEALMQMHRNEEGLKYLRKAYELDPLEQKFVNVYASNLYHSGHFGEALEPALIYLGEMTQPAELQRAKLQVLTLIRKLPAADVQKAVAAADKKLDRTPWQGRMQLALGDVYDALGKRERAEQCYEKGIELLPHLGRPYFRLARDYEQDNRYPQALALYHKAYELEPDDEQVKRGYARFTARMLNRKNDIAWHLKDWIQQAR